MARIKLTAPGNTLAVVTVPVRITDINYGNHLGNDSFISIIHEARVQWLRLHQYSELDVEGTGLILADLAVEFRSEGFYGDRIEISISAGEISRVSFELFYSLWAERNGEKKLLAVAKTGMVCYDYAAKKVAALPEKLQSLLKAQG